MFGSFSAARRFAPCLPLALSLALALLCAPAHAAQVEVNVDVNEPTTELSPVLYGLFFEDINYAADGGIYAELIENRSFEYYPIGNRGAGSRMQPLTAWEAVQREGGTAALEVTDASPLNPKNTKYLKMTLGGTGTAGVRNRGFEGIPLEQGAQYVFSVFARRTADTSRPLTVALESAGGDVLATATIPGVSGEWSQYEATLTPAKSEPAARLALTTAGGGELHLDMVSLFPRETFKGRENGMRADLAQALADLNPKFLRFPGGCILHGSGLDNTYLWKDTVGPVEERKPNWNRWGYHQSYGLGYFEYMQLCEDLGATPLPVVPVGVSCGFNRPYQAVPIDELGPWIQDALDLIEFANGPADSQWGKVRAEMGHPEPFGLEYICLGNEEHDTPEFRERFPYFVNAIREAHPEIKIIGTSGLSENIPTFDLMDELDVYSSDEHYYLPPEWYLRNTDRFDTFDRDAPKIFVGEYASEGITLYNAVAEAAFLTGVERNGDIVDMTCYAPLFAKEDFTQWNRANLIYFDNHQLMKTPNYYVQQLFSQNKGDVYLKNEVVMQVDQENLKQYEGKVGVGTWLTSIVVESATLNGEPVDLTGGRVMAGDFAVTEEGYAQRDAAAEAAVSVAEPVASGDKITYTVRAKKTGGAEGFLLIFGHTGDSDYYWWNVGGWGNTQHGIERRVNGRTQTVATTRGRIRNDRWYDLKVELTPGRIQCYIDGELVQDYKQEPPGVSVSPTMDKAAGELIVKLVNPSEEPVEATINLNGAVRVATTAQLTTLAGSPTAVNTIGQENIAPETKTIPAGETTRVKLPGMSVNVMRVKVN